MEAVQEEEEEELEAPAPVFPSIKRVNKWGGQVDEGMRYTGVVNSYNNRRGFGFIDYTPEGASETEQIFLHWKEIVSDDKWVSLEVGSTVEFYAGVYISGDKLGQKYAAHVTRGGGVKVTAKDRFRELQISDDYYTGTVVHFDGYKGFGVVTLDTPVEIGEHKLEEGAQISVGRENIVSNDEPPCLIDGSKVKFKIWNDATGENKYCAHDVVNPDGSGIHYPLDQRPPPPGDNGWGPMKGGWGPWAGGGGGGSGGWGNPADRWTNMGGPSWGRGGGGGGGGDFGGGFRGRGRGRGWGGSGFGGGGGGGVFDMMNMNPEQMMGMMNAMMGRGGMGGGRGFGRGFA